MEKKIKPIYPNSQFKSFCYIKSVITRPNIIAGDYSYYDDSEDGPESFEKHVTHHYEFMGDKLIIGKFCQIGHNVEFIMNGANHQMNSVSTYPFYIFKGWKQESPKMDDLPFKGDTVVGNDVWIGQNVIILPGVHIGDGCIIGANSVVGSDIPPYSVVVGNPAKVIRKRFDDEMVDLLEKLQWWNKTENQIEKILPLLSNSDIEYVKKALHRLTTKE